MQSDRQSNRAIGVRRASVSVSLAGILLIVIAGLAIRLAAVPLYTNPDMGSLRTLANSIYESGLFRIYGVSAQAGHAPIELASIGIATQIFRSSGGDMETDGAEGQLMALKAASTFFDIATVIIAYVLIFKLVGPLWALLPATAIAFNPATIIVSSTWGQTDSIFTFFLVLSVAALYFRSNRIAWIAWALSIMSKLQALILLPLLLTATWVPRTPGVPVESGTQETKSPWRRLRVGITSSAIILVAIMLPFFIGSGMSAVQALKQDATDLHFLTLNAYNLWWWQSNAAGNIDSNVDDSASDLQTLPGTPVSYRAAGWILFAAFVLLVVFKAAASPLARNEFLLAGLLFVGFFMLLTQMHERNLYPALALFALASVGRDRRGKPRIDRRGLFFYMAFSLTFLDNIAATSAAAPPQVVTFVTFLFPGGRDDIARVNVLLLMAAVIVLIWPRRFKMPSPDQVSSLYMAARPHGQKS